MTSEQYLQSILPKKTPRQIREFIRLIGVQIGREQEQGVRRSFDQHRRIAEQWLAKLDPPELGARHGA